MSSLRSWVCASGSSLGSGDPPALALTLLVVYLLSYASWRYFERPAQRLILSLDRAPRPSFIWQRVVHGVRQLLPEAGAGQAEAPIAVATQTSTAMPERSARSL